MSEKSLKSNAIPIGRAGLVLAIIFCVTIARSRHEFYSVLLGVVLGFAGLVASVLGIVKRSARTAGIFGVIFSLLGALMTFTIVCNLITAAQHPDRP
jgi:hypothetical protein